MRVRARLLLYGAVLPTLGTLLAVGIAGQLFRFSLLRTMDEALNGQAAVEAISLFDGPGGEPHFHLHNSPKGGEGAVPSGVVAVYDASGAPVLRFPEKADVPSRILPDERRGLANVRAADGAPMRELVVNLVSKNGQHYVLREAVPLSSVDVTMRTFYQATLTACAVMALLLALVQTGQARRLSARIHEMTAHLPRLREGNFDVALPPDPSGDELGELRLALIEATRQLLAARDRQDRLIANAAHELRTPLSVMRTGMDLALRRERSAEELRQTVVEARQEVVRLAALAQDLLDVAAAGRVTLERVPSNVGAVVREAVEARRAEAESRRIALEVRAPATAAAELAPVRVRQAVDNLLANALRFAPEGTRVRVEVTDHQRWWRIVVEDEGPGVPAQERERIFDPFHRLPGSQGAGLGLAIVREVAREHDGQVALLPSDAGARFAVDIGKEAPKV
jgi:signal transduction histidine kinase